MIAHRPVAIPFLQFHMYKTACLNTKIIFKFYLYYYLLTIKRLFNFEVSRLIAALNSLTLLVAAAAWLRRAFASLECVDSGLSVRLSSKNFDVALLLLYCCFYCLFVVENVQSTCCDLEEELLVVVKIT